MSDETDYVRRTCEAATTGPWRAGRQQDGWPEVTDQHSTDVCSPDLFADARAIALLGSTWREALAVIEALGHVLGFRSDPTVLDEALRRLDDYHAAVRAHREVLGDD